ncbi:MAG: DUF3857 domain-containing protein [Chitinophagaceae bacterium]
MRQSIIFFLLILTSLNSNCQEYASNLIPDSLKQDVDAVLRKENLDVLIVDIDKAIVKHKYAITILNENADVFAQYTNQYDNLKSLSDISATLYDGNGVKIKSLKRRDIYDVKADGNNFLTDNRVKAFSFAHKIYPYTVEFEDEQSYDGIYYLPVWSPVMDTRFSVQHSKFTVEVPLDYELRFKQISFAEKPSIATNKKIRYTWELQNFKGLESEIFMPSWNQVLPSVIIAPTKFLIEGFKGDMATWSDLGKFQILLNEGRNNLPDNIKSAVHALVDNVKSDEEKVRLLYEYLQHNTRYISIQLGIGGWQPLPANFVAEKKYGDCKALSNFMIALLKEANIYGYYTIIKSGEKEIGNGLDEAFPVTHFNHIITCVPLPKDTMWLECTSQTESAGYTGSFTGNRKALMITDKGGVVVNTTKFIASENVEQRFSQGELNEKGDLVIKNKAVYTGLLQEFHHSLLNDLSEQERLKLLNKEIDLPTYSIDKLELKEVRGKIPKINEIIDITAPAYAAVSGKRMFVVANIFNKKNKLKSDKPRLFDIVYKKAYTEVDSVEIKVPTGYAVESIPKAIDVVNKFGNYRITFSFNNSVIKAVRYYQQEVNKFPPSDYTDLVKFYDEMYKADRAKIVLVKQL